jgi:hypothetical protein
MEKKNEKRIVRGVNLHAVACAKITGGVTIFSSNINVDHHRHLKDDQAILQPVFHLFYQGLRLLICISLQGRAGLCCSSRFILSRLLILYSLINSSNLSEGLFSQTTPTFSGECVSIATLNHA